MNWKLVTDYGEIAEDFTLDANGRIVRDQTAATVIALALSRELGQWWATPGRGSRLRALMRGIPPADAVLAVEDAVRESMARLEQDGRIADVTVKATLLDTGRVRIAASAVDLRSNTVISIATEGL